MQNKVPSIAGSGICCVDYIVVAPQVRWGDQSNVSRYLVQGGGLIGTALVACARLGARCELLTLLGDDEIGEQILSELEQEGIPSDHVMKVPGGESPFSFIHVDDKSGERTIFHRSGTGLQLQRNMLRLDDAARWDCLLVDDIYPELSLAAAQAAREHGVPVVADLIPSESSNELLQLVDVLIAPRHYARGIGCGDDLDAALDHIHSLGPTTAVITLGSDGWVFSDRVGRGRGEAFKVEVVDTTGAGDTFHGAFAYGLARRWDTRKCAEFASAVAAIKCTVAGGRTGLPSLGQVEEFLADR